jgi:hypothetical protein
MKSVCIDVMGTPGLRITASLADLALSVEFIVAFLFTNESLFAFEGIKTLIELIFRMNITIILIKVINRFAKDY